LNRSADFGVYRVGGGFGVNQEEELMNALYSGYYGMLLAFVSRYVRDRHRAEDLVQETLLRTWRNIDRIDLGQDPRPYLFTIARNVLTNAWRDEQRRPRLVSDDAAMAAVPSGDDVEAQLEGWLVAAALERLSAEHQSVVKLLYVQGRTVAEAAAHLRVPAGTVKSRAYYAVRALRAAFEERGVLS
jgi:RNA polymerase sigma-70 factor, ECF subfamily